MNTNTIVPGHSVARPLRGALLVLAAVLVFACMDASIKHLSAHYPIPLIIACRYAVHLVLMLVLVLPQNGRTLFQTQRSGMVLIRAGFLLLGSLFAGLAMKAMPVAETTAIIYFAPLGVMLLAGPLLKERVLLPSVIAAVAGFIGVLVIVRPGTGLSTIGVTFALMNAVVTIGYHLMSRMLAKTESTIAMLFYTALSGTVVFGAMVPWNWHGPVPEPLDIALFVGIGGMGFLGHYCFTSAYREAPASFLSPFNYMHIFWAGCLGWLVFDHVPDLFTILGGVLIALAGIGGTLWLSIYKPKAEQIPTDMDRVL